MSALRPLPPRPSLEFDRKAAKALLHEARANDRDAIARIRAVHPTHATNAGIESFTLSDAQLVIAREYGFASWPRLMQYHEGITRQKNSFPTLQKASFYVQHAASVVQAHRNNRQWAGRLLAAYVPQFFGLSVDEVYGKSVTENDARLAVARANGCASWELLLERAENEATRRTQQQPNDPQQRAYAAMRDADLAALQSLVAAHPELIATSAEQEAANATLGNVLFDCELTQGREPLRPIADWLTAQGVDLSGALNRRWFNRRPKSADDVHALVARGADPNFVSESGITPLEHMLVRIHGREASEALATHVTPRDALWIAAGLGDLSRVRRYFDAHGTLTPAARQSRPPLDAMHGFSIPMLPDPDDHELLYEVFWVAALNERIAVMEFLITVGVDVNFAGWGVPLVNIAVGNGWTPIVECLVRAGADLDIDEGNSNGTARQLARSMWESGAHGPKYRRIAELCGLELA